MALVHTDSGVIAVPLTANEAQALTAKIKGYVSSAWIMLVEAHDRLAHVALGYGTWEEYVRVEFDISRQHAYRLLDQGRVIAEIEAAVSPMGDITPEQIADVVNEREARAIKPVIAEVADAIRSELAAAADLAPDDIVEIVESVVDTKTAEAKKRAEDQQAIADLNANGQKARIETDLDRATEQGAFARLCTDMAKQADPADFVARHRDWLNDRRIGLAEKAYAWLETFLKEAK